MSWYDDEFEPMPVIRHTYSLWLAGDRKHHRPFLEHGTREEAARMIRTARNVGVAVEVTHHETPDFQWVIWCRNCGARPVYWDYDCDGKYPTATCMDEQCEAGNREYRRWMGWV
ncbi:hypothetical protein SEA_GREENWEASEL_78 [Streptomyces phage GreenWeasel]|nr:hypothetical protein SEA_GREENWEASEL_78 [Streptomyces phage GreenWeasel]